MKSLILVIGILAEIALTRARGAETLVIPKQFVNQEAPSSQNVFIPDIHRHYLIGRAYFQQEIPEGALISGISMRVNQINEISSALVHAELSLSTHPVLPFFLSRTYSDNIGADVQHVFRGDIHIADSAPGKEVKPFDVLLPFDSPFYYDPRKGNLLLDLSVTSGADRLFLDGFQGPDVASVLSAGGVQGTLAGNFAPVLRFTYTTVPEPGVMALLFLSSMMLFGVRRQW